MLATIGHCIYIYLYEYDQKHILFIHNMEL